MQLISAPDAAPFAAGGVISPQTPSVSHDGRFIAYVSNAADIVPGQNDNNGTADVFLYDRLTNTNTLVSHSAGNPLVAGRYSSGTPVISADGRYIAYASQSPDLMAGENNRRGLTTFELYLYDRITGVNSLVSHVASDPLMTNETGIGPCPISPPTDATSRLRAVSRRDRAAAREPRRRSTIA